MSENLAFRLYLPRSDYAVSHFQLPINDMDEKPRPFQIAILLYPGVTALDAVGPWEYCHAPITDVRFVGKEI